MNYIKCAICTHATCICLHSYNMHTYKANVSSTYFVYNLYTFCTCALCMCCVEHNIMCSTHTAAIHFCKGKHGILYREAMNDATSVRHVTCPTISLARFALTDPKTVQQLVKQLKSMNIYYCFPQSSCRVCFSRI